MEILDKFLTKSVWIAGSNVTIADLSVVSNVAQIKACGYDISKHANLFRWYESCKTIHGFEENENGAIELGKIIQSRVGNQFE